MNHSEVVFERGELCIPTNLKRGELLDRLRQWEPWRHEIHFSNGVKTTDLKTEEPFAKRMGKWFQFEPLIPDEAIRGGRALDVGFNAGYYSLLLASKYGMEVTGIEYDTGFEEGHDAERHRQVAEFLCEQARLTNVSFEMADATFYRRPEYYDLILHFGTLYHLRHPFLSLENMAASLRPGGYLALETQTFRSEDGTLCKFFPGYYMSDRSRDMIESCGSGIS